MFGKIKKIIPIPFTAKIFSALLTLLSGTLFARFLNIKPRRGPLFMSWLVTYDCNAQCRFCSTHAMKKKYPDDVGLARSREIAHEMGKAGVWVVGFTGGEVFLWPHLFEIIGILKGYGVVVYIVTNGLMLKENTQAVLDSCLDYVVVSIDSDDAEEHDALRNCPGLFDKAIEGMAYLKENRKGKFPAIKTTTLLARHNLVKIERILNFLARYADQTSIQPIVNDYGNSVHNRSDTAVRDLTFDASEREIVQRELDKLVAGNPNFMGAYFKEIGTAWFNPARLKASIHCWSPFLRLLVLPNGDVFHCLANERYGPVGNLKRSSLMEVWGGDVIREQREEIRRHNNKCICWTQDSSFNALLNSIPLLSQATVWKWR